MSDPIMETLLPILLSALVTLIAGIISAFCPKLFVWIKTKTEAIKLGSDKELVKYAMDIVQDLVSKACYVTQSTADAMKKVSEDGKLTDEDIQNLKNEVIKLVGDAIPDISGKTVEEILGGPEKFEAMIYTVIDSVVQSRKTVTISPLTINPATLN
jgi:hypothetical protein